MDSATILSQNLSKNFGPIKAVDKISLGIKKGEIYALIGPNGAGKTTLIKMLVGLLPASSGKACIAGHNIATSPLEAKKKFGYLPDNPSVYDYLTGYEFLQLTGSLSGLSQEVITKRTHELSKIFPNENILNQKMGNYSRGNRQKVGFLASIMAPHEALIIDEPIVGLDPQSITIFGAYLTKFAALGGSILLATHTLSFAQKYAHRVGLMQDGKLVEEKFVSKINLEKLYMGHLSHDEHL